ncbi:MAG: undecaprenyl-phosphate glucose phosphotransferase [Spirochaetaceae bacterium]|nr:undecaprenyl-phosphate glucose phosphotransferase [Spirochaetaceae bacterium]
MIKSYRKSFAFQLLILDGLASSLAWALAYYVRFSLLQETEGWELTFLNLGILMVVLNWFCFKMNHLYEDIESKAWYREFISVSFSVVHGTVSMAVLYYFFSPTRVSRGQLLLYLIFAECFFCLFRVMFRNHIHNMYTKGKLSHKLILAGNGPQLEKYITVIRKLPELGYRFVGWLDDGGLAEQYGIPRLEEAPITELIETWQPECVVVGYPEKDRSKAAEILEYSFDSLASFIVLTDTNPNFVGTTIDEFFGVPLVRINHPRENFFSGLLKRNMDIVLSALGLLVLSPLFLLVAVLIKITSRGPVFFTQERMTLDGDIFLMYKFRSMRVFTDGTNEKGWTVKNDPRITRFGSFLRQTSLDEFPQLWNILRGDMSLVGPRPERPIYIQEFRKKVPAYMLRHKMKAGLTGWAQVNGWRGDTSIEKRIEFDLYYIRHWSVWFDIKILVLTVVRGFVNKNAY